MPEKCISPYYLFVKTTPCYVGSSMTDFQCLFTLQGLPDPDDRSCLSAFFINVRSCSRRIDGIPDNVVSRCVDLDVRRQFGFIHLGSNGSTDHCRAVFVSCIVLDDEYRTDPSLLTSHHRTKIRIINISSSYIHILHTPIPMFCQKISDIYSISLFIRCMQVYKKFIDGCSLFGR